MAIIYYLFHINFDVSSYICGLTPDILNNLLLINRKMKQGIKTYKFNFHATLGQFSLNAPNINTPLAATWKRSSESVSTSTVDMAAGKANFNQTITLPLNMYFEEANQVFQQKKTLFTFNMQTPKGEKQAGVVYVQVASMLNNKVSTLAQLYTLEKCPVKDSKVSISITAELVGEAALSDSISVNSGIFNQSLAKSTLSIQSKGPSSTSSKIKEEVKEETSSTKPQSSQSSSAIKQKNNSQVTQKNKKIEALQSQVKKLTKQKEQLAKELEKQRKRDAGSEVAILKQSLSKSKHIQQKLQNEMNNLRSENIQHERQLQKMRIRMQQIYELLFSNLNQLY